MTQGTVVWQKAKPLLWAGLQAAGGRITISGIANHVH
jgi:hypothetical protein